MIIFFGILAFFVILAALFLIHEGGHFFAARAFGIRVEEVGFGFGKTLFRGMFRGIPWSVNAIPIGAFVKLFGEEGGDAAHPESFTAKPAWQKVAVIVAGIAGNWAAAVLIFSVMLILQMPRVVPDEAIDPQTRVLVWGVVPASPAATAGIEQGDEIMRLRAGDVDIAPLKTSHVQKFMQQYAGEPVTIVIRRIGRFEPVSVQALPRQDPAPGEGALGVTLVREGTMQVPWYEAWWQAVFLTARLTIVIAFSVASIGSELFSGVIPEDVASPVGIAVLTVGAARLGIAHLLWFAGLISLSLALLNAIPFPALDGSRIVQIVWEHATGRRIPQRVLELVYGGGMALLIIFVTLLAVQDVRRFILPNFL